MKLSDKIVSIKARQILTSRGLPTVEVEFTLDGTSIISSVPSGKSVGTREAFIRFDSESSYFGLSVISVVNEIKNKSKMLLSIEMETPVDLDRKMIMMDGTPNKSRLGANFILPISICTYKLYAHCLGLDIWKYIQLSTRMNYRIPVPHFNVLNGGMHSGNGVSCQEIMICFEEEVFSKSLQLSVEFYDALKNAIADEYGALFTSVGDEGGFAPPIKTTEEGLILVMKAAKKIQISNFRIALDLAANSFFNEDFNNYTFDGEEMNGKALADRYSDLIERYPIYMVEDPFGEKDIQSWEYLYGLVGEKIRIVADDLTVTNPKIISCLGNKRMFNTVLIKPNQVGSVSETIEAVQTAKRLGLGTMASHRSAETEDVFIAHLAVGMGCEYIKLGAPCRGERIGKYNELIRIEERIANENEDFVEVEATDGFI